MLLLLGEEEEKAKKVSLKNMETGEQEVLDLSCTLKKIKE